MPHGLYCNPEATRKRHNGKAKLKLQVSNGEIHSTSNVWM